MSPLEQEILDTIATETGIADDELGDDTTFYEMGIDSLSALEILAVLESKYGVVLDEQELRDTGTIRAVVRSVATKIKDKGGVR